MPQRYSFDQDFNWPQLFSHPGQLQNYITAGKLQFQSSDHNSNVILQRLLELKTLQLLASVHQLPFQINTLVTKYDQVRRLNTLSGARFMVGVHRQTLDPKAFKVLVDEIDHHFIRVQDQLKLIDQPDFMINRFLKQSNFTSVLLSYQNVVNAVSLDDWSIQHLFETSITMPIHDFKVWLCHQNGYASADNLFVDAKWFYAVTKPVFAFVVWHHHVVKQLIRNLVDHSLPTYDRMLLKFLIETFGCSEMLMEYLTPLQQNKIELKPWLRNPYWKEGH